MRFICPKAKKSEDLADLPPNLSRKISLRWFLLKILLSILGGVIFALALPPVNLGILGVFTLSILLLVIIDLPLFRAGICGFAWGVGWSLTSFFWIREIHIVVPFFLTIVLSSFPMVWAVVVSWLCRRILIPAKVRFEGSEAVKRFYSENLSMWRMGFLAVVVSALWVLIEALRSTMLPWNNLSTTMWQEPRMLALSSVTGAYGIGFLLALIGTTFALGVKCRNKSGRMRLFPTFVAIILAWLLPTLAISYNKAQKPSAESTTFTLGAVQGDISQRRNANNREAEEALDIYLSLTDKLLQSQKVNLVVWPETAVPYAFKGVGEVSARYRQGVHALLEKYKTPMLIGTIDFAFSLDKARTYEGITNSALFITPPFGESARYDKIHRVPYGEYIPFRSCLPQFFLNAIDMNRDLVPGRNYAPIEIYPNVYAGVSICFESVFAYVAREEVRRGANMLLVISNDAWYPTSCEPEQHLANAIMRSVETGLYTVRCGNNGGTLVISPEGKIVDVLEVAGPERKELRRGRGVGVFELTIPNNPPMTLYVRYGGWFLCFCGIVSALGLFWACRSEYRENILHRGLLVN